jgi:hypothetical protein
VNIEDDGSFATAVYPGRSLEFYAHGHNPLIIETGKHFAGSVFDVVNIISKKPRQHNSAS